MIRRSDLPFSKLEALGNDFMLVDARRRECTPAPDTIRSWSDRHRGVGFDQLLILRPADTAEAHCRVDIHNADGSAAEQCGNGMRAVALWLHDNGEVGERFTLATAGGRVDCRFGGPDDIAASLGVPDFTPASVGLRGIQTFPWQREVDGETLEVHGAAVGNPHLLVVTDRAPTREELMRIGPTLAGDDRLARGANVGLARIASSGRVELMVLERGAGPTLACGSGAAVAAAMLIRLGRVISPVEVAQPGGSLVVHWPGEGQAVSAAGPARHVFEGVMSWPTRSH